MLNVLKLFFRAEGTKPWMVLTCLLMAGVFDGIGLASLLPLVALATGEGQSDDSVVTQVLTTTLNSIGLQLEMVPLLFMVIGALIVKCLLSLVPDCQAARLKNATAVEANFTADTAHKKFLRRYYWLAA